MDEITLECAQKSSKISIDELAGSIQNKADEEPFVIKKSDSWFLEVDPVKGGYFILTENKGGKQRVIMDFADKDMVLNAASLLAKSASLDEVQDKGRQWSEYRGKERFAGVQWAIIVAIFAIVAYGVVSVFYSLFFT